MSSGKVLRVCVTGAAGQIAYSLLPHICLGRTFGPDTGIILHLLDIERAQTVTPPILSRAPAKRACVCVNRSSRAHEHLLCEDPGLCAPDNSVCTHLTMLALILTVRARTVAGAEWRQDGARRLRLRPAYGRHLHV
jgi:hypothetical protein